MPVFQEYSDLCQNFSARTNLKTETSSLYSYFLTRQLTLHKAGETSLPHKTVLYFLGHHFHAVLSKK